MPANSDIVDKTSAYVRALLSEKLPPWSVYHTFEHTLEVVEAAEEIGAGSRLGRTDMETVRLAAWLHDVGYVETIQGHEAASAAIARNFLAAEGYPEQRIEEVCRCIDATRVDTQPAGLNGAVLRDADMIHLGKKSFLSRSDLLRLEMEKRQGKSYSDSEWLKINLEFLVRNPFLTEYARNEYGKRREKNLLDLQELVKEAEARERAKSEKRGEKDAAKMEAARRPERGIETVFRVVPQIHQNLSAIADSKANIMLSSNSLIISLVFGLLVSKLDTNPYLVFPTFLLMAVCLSAIVFAVLATRPKISSGTFTREDIRQRKVNLLFFGNFHSVPLEDFEWGMKEMMGDREYLYGSMIRDLYFLGQVLARKYRYLRICYSVFMYGLIASVLAFLISFLYVPTIID
jgi:putative nucleotidyltransferase with HDIG domain